MTFSEILQSTLRHYSTEGVTCFPLCQLTGRSKPMDVKYKYFVGNPASHRIQFSKGHRVFFELRLDEEGRRLRGFADAAESMLTDDLNHQLDMGIDTCREPVASHHVLAITERILLFVLGRRIITCFGPLGETSSQRQGTIALEGRFRTSLGRCYYLVKLAGWRKGSIVILEKKATKGSSRHRKGKSFRYCWAQMAKNDLVRLSEAISDFLATDDNGLES